MQKKKPNKPIQITLTEEQIASIIERAAKTRRGLKVESLEDRIAPSVIGVAPLGTSDPLGGDPVNDPLLNDPANDPLLNDPANDPLLNDPANPGGDGLVLPPDPTGTANFDPKVEGEPPLPPADEGAPVPPTGGDPNFVADHENPGVLPPSGDPPVHDPIQNELPPMDTLTDENGGFAMPNPGFDGNIDPNLVGRANDLFTNTVNEHMQVSGNAPTAEELEEYRANVLRQLRG